MGQWGALPISGALPFSLPLAATVLHHIFLPEFIPCRRVRYCPYYLRWGALPMKMDGGGHQLLCRWDDMLILQYVV
jgi:hypothetical protein